MSIFEDIKAKGSAYRLSEEALYAEALRELESGQLRDGIWAKAMSESDMDQGKASARYIKLRVISLREEITILIDELKESKTQSLLPPQDASMKSNSTLTPSKAFFDEGVVIILVVFLISVIYVVYSSFRDKKHEQPLIEQQPLKQTISSNDIEITLVKITEYSPCNKDRPFLTTITNNSKSDRVNQLSFVLRAYSPGYSTVRESVKLYTDKIFLPGETHQLCLGNNESGSQVVLTIEGSSYDFRIGDIRLN